jgi:hypothetical protein
MSICPIWNFTLYVTQSLHFLENHLELVLKHDKLGFTKNKYNMFKAQDYDSMFFTTKLHTQLFVRVCILLTYGKYMHDHIISV